jgi:hypothetical protein
MEILKRFFSKKIRMGKRNRELLELLLLAACFFYLSIAKLQWLPQRDRSFHHRSFATVVNSLRASVIVDCKPAESPLAEIEMERERSRCLTKQQLRTNILMLRFHSLFYYYTPSVLAACATAELSMPLPH